MVNHERTINTLHTSIGYRQHTKPLKSQGSSHVCTSAATNAPLARLTPHKINRKTYCLLGHGSLPSLVVDMAHHAWHSFSNSIPGAGYQCLTDTAVLVCARVLCYVRAAEFSRLFLTFSVYNIFINYYRSIFVWIRHGITRIYISKIFLTILAND